MKMSVSDFLSTQLDILSVYYEALEGKFKYLVFLA